MTDATATAAAADDAATATGSPATSDAARLWVPPLISTAVTVPLGFLAYFFAGFSAMACDPCTGAVADRFDDSFGPAFTVFRCGLVLSGILLFVSWGAVEWSRRRDVVALLAALAPVSLCVGFVAFLALVSWP